MSLGFSNSLADRLDSFLELQERRMKEPDPFHILNVTRTESPYTHFFGWLLDPTAAHTWDAEFLHALLARHNQPLPPPGPITFFVEAFAFEKDPADAIGFTCPDILAAAPNVEAPTWCLLIENKFDSKEGRASEKATQCAIYEQRARAQFGSIDLALLFTTKSGESAFGETGFAAVSYSDVSNAIQLVRKQLISDGRWASSDQAVADRYGFYMVDAFLRHMQLSLPDDELRLALRKLARGERPTGVKQSWIAARPGIEESAAKQEKVLDRWDLDTMVSQIRSLGASDNEVSALEALYEWGEQVGDCDFQASKKSSFVIRIPTSGAPVLILTIQARSLRFYWGHFIGGYDDTARPNRQSKKFSHAYALAERYCRELNEAFDWELRVVREKNGEFDGFYEPSRPLQEVADPAKLKRFLDILSTVASDARGD